MELINVNSFEPILWKIFKIKVIKHSSTDSIGVFSIFHHVIYIILPLDRRTKPFNLTKIGAQTPLFFLA